jgi:arginine utilization protein RocB
MTVSARPNAGLAATPLGRRAEAHTLAVVEHLSVTGTEGEATCAGTILARLEDMPGVTARAVPVPGVPEGRANVVAFAKGSGRRTVVLAGHFDTVAVDDYGPLAPLATAPLPLRDALVDALGAAGEGRHVLDDLSSGAFLPGRGLLDMKAGLGAGMAVIEAFAAREEKVGNIVFLAVPDEENQSAGMRSAGAALADLAREHDLDLALLINMDALIDEGDGSHGRAVGLGCIGKHLFTALVVGREAHACYPFTGLNAAYLAAAITAEMEGAPALAEQVGDEALAPPTALVARDLKLQYDVTTPGRVWCAFNVLFQARTAEDLFRTYRGLVGDAVRLGVERLAERALAARLPFGFAGRDVAILSYAELDRAACEASPDYPDARRVLAAELAGDAALAMPDRARRLTELALAHAGLTGPLVVLGFGSLSYPSVRPLRHRAPELESVVRTAAARAAARADTTLRFLDALPIICDMSFAAPPDAADYAVATESNPLWGEVLEWNAEGLADVPSINIGPWGRDYHHRHERMHVRYGFDVLPSIIAETADAVLAGA